MKYELVELREKKVAGIMGRTNNNAEDMYVKIGKAWEDFYNKGYAAGMKNRTNDYAIGLYANYESDANGDYDFYACAEVNSFDGVSKELSTAVIEAGKYAKFEMKGNMNEVVGKFWTELWAMNLDRTYTSDFELYKEMGEDEVTMEFYIAVK